MPHEYRRRTDANLPLWPMGFVFLLAAMIGLVYLMNVMAMPNAELPPRTMNSVAANPEEAPERSVAIEGTVREQWGPKAFTIRDQNGQEMLVIDASQKPDDDAISVSVPPPSAHIEGRVFRKDDPELRRSVPPGFDQHLLDDYAGKTVLLATTVRETETSENKNAR